MQIKIDKIIHGGYGLGHDKNGLPVFVFKALKDEILDIDIIKTNKKFSFGAIKKIIQKSPDRIVSDCPHFDLCGGCDFRNISYQNELKIKKQILTDSLNFAKITSPVKEIYSASPETFYRNNSRFFFSIINSKVELCMTNFDYQKGLLPVSLCLHSSPLIQTIINGLKTVYSKIEDPLVLPWQIKIREGKFTHEFMIEIVTKNSILNQKNELISFFKSLPEVKSLYHTISTDKNLRLVERKLLFGAPIIFERIGPYKFQISPSSFFQTNSLGVKNLYDRIKIAARGESFGHNIIDLFCGAGTIGIYLSNFAKNVVGIDLVKDAIKDARENAKINKISNARFEIADLNSINLKNTFLKIGVDQPFLNNSIIILDPPRDGLSRGLIEQISTIEPKSIIMVSCNPATMIRDLKIFAENGLKPEYIEPIDMFPRTHHQETITKLIKSNKGEHEKKS